MENNASVAIVDDEKYILRAYEILFQRRNIPIAFTAEDGDEAIEKFKKANPRPKIVIIDYRLPSMSGLDVMKAIKEIEPSTKIVFISGDDSIKQESLGAGANAFMKKPTSNNVITETITGLINT